VITKFVRSIVFPLTARRGTAAELVNETEQPDFLPLIQQFLQDKLNSLVDINEIKDLPTGVYNSVRSVIYSPSDPSGKKGMRQEFIRAVQCWRGGRSRYDCIFVNTEDDPLTVARACLFFQFAYRDIIYSCALLHWFMKPESELNELNGMWVVEPRLNPDGTRVSSIVNINALICAAHLLPVFDNKAVPRDLNCEETLDYFTIFYINRYVDHHSFLIL
jgi:hypothetical protein